ncbi:ABC transporter substrate-binding protein [Halorussus amylolyticus]|uniref:ABC transporter substrate-binding protein n=1 Tax=Halorussus amylolyticus TaxID=1126242 RepID=UPI00104C7964|nr:ABC transporter substrate-binding protein [Halorussus amylolyticus]
MPHRRNRSNGTDGSRRNFLKASGAGAVALSLAGCSGGESEQGTTEESGDTEATETTEETVAENTSDSDEIPQGGTLVYGMSSNPDTSNYLMAGSVYSAVALDLVYDYGVEIDPVTYDIRPWAFTDWELQNEDADQPEVVFNVRDDLTWNDGEDFTIEDVIFSHDYIIENQVGEFSTVWNNIESVEEDDGDWDCRMTLTQQIGTWDSSALGACPMLPEHIWSDVDDFENYDPMEERENGPVGTGPGILTQFDPDTSMQIQFRDPEEYPLTDQDWIDEHDNLVAGGPFLDQVNFQVYGEEAAMTQAFMRGEIDTHYGTLDTDKIPEAQDTDGLGLVKGYDSGFSYMGINCRREPLDDVALRQVVSFCFDDYYWTQELQQDYVYEGDFAQSPGYSGVRPETVFDGELLEDPATQAFTFRGIDESADPDVEAMREFLENGEVIDGSEGTYAGQEYPGSLSGAEASQSEAKYDYTFEEAQSSELEDYSEEELYVDGEPISEVMNDGAITILMDPPSDYPKQSQAFERWSENMKKVGIPVKLEPTEFNTMSDMVYYDAEFDVYEMGWGGTGVFGTSVRSFFHSDFAKEAYEEETYAYNSTGYGVAGGSSDELIMDAYTEMDPEARNEKFATALEKVYLDMPYMVRDYAKMRWPMNTADFTGAVEPIVDPAYANWHWQAYHLHQTE